MTMPIRYALRHRDSAETHLRELASTAEICGLTHHAVTSQSLAIINKLPKTCPYWVRCYLEGFWKAVRWELEHRHTMYAGFVKVHKEFELPRTVLLSTHAGRDDYYGKHGFTARQWHERALDRGYYWIRTGQPYFISEPGRALSTCPNPDGPGPDRKEIRT